MTNITGAALSFNLPGSRAAPTDATPAASAVAEEPEHQDEHDDGAETAAAEPPGGGTREQASQRTSHDCLLLCRWMRTPEVLRAQGVPRPAVKPAM
jgi:hypothetical protein